MSDSESISVSESETDISKRLKYQLFVKGCMELRTIDETNFSGKRVLIRVDFNVPIESGKIKDESRIRKTIPTLKYILKGNPKQVILMSHLGSPKGKVDEQLRLSPVASALSRMLKIGVVKTDDCIGEIPHARIVLLENLRFHPGEESNDSEFARKLASKGELYVNDAFSAAHRAHASIVGIPKYLPSYAGLLMEEEVDTLNSLLSKPEKPFALILGGAKLSSKLPLIKSLLQKIDKVLIGGAMAFTFLKAKGLETGKSLVENDFIGEAKAILESGKIVLPADIVVSRSPEDSEFNTVSASEIPKELMGLDIGRETIRVYEKELKGMRTVFWNGPMGMFEIERFAAGTREIVRILSRLDAKVIAGGGETVMAIQQEGAEERFAHVSTGGGATLEFLEGKELPGIVPLKKG